MDDLRHFISEQNPLAMTEPSNGVVFSRQGVIVGVTEVSADRVKPETALVTVDALVAVTDSLTADATGEE